MVSEGGGSLPILVSLRRASQEIGERAKPAASHGKRVDLLTTQNLPSTRRPFEELLTALRKVICLPTAAVLDFPHLQLKILEE